MVSTPSPYTVRVTDTSQGPNAHCRSQRLQAENSRTTTTRPSALREMGEESSVAEAAMASWSWTTQWSLKTALDGTYWFEVNGAVVC